LFREQFWLRDKWRLRPEFGLLFRFPPFLLHIDLTYLGQSLFKVATHLFGTDLSAVHADHCGIASKAGRSFTFEELRLSAGSLAPTDLVGSKIPSCKTLRKTIDSLFQHV
jgi:hypothetical protein